MAYMSGTVLVGSFVKRISIASLALGLPVAVVQAVAAEPWPSRVQATYRIDFNGFDVGTFEFNATVSGQSYSATGDARLSALLGAFKWRGETRSAGAIAGGAPKPAGYTFDFNGTGKAGSIKMGFAGEQVANVAHSPPHTPAPGTIPVRDTHLKGVLDPLSAVLALSRSGNENPCGRRLPIFDGKQRFDLVFTYHRQERIAETRPSGQPGIGYVCKVRFVPVAGHKMNEDTRTLAQSSGIEVVLRPVPSANLFVPYQIRVPTAAGTATLVSQRVQIVTQRNEQIALTH